MADTEAPKTETEDDRDELSEEALDNAAGGGGGLVLKRGGPPAPGG